jgi:hypothetical protein
MTSREASERMKETVSKNVKNRNRQKKPKQRKQPKKRREW